MKSAIVNTSYIASESLENFNFRLTICHKMHPLFFILFPIGMCHDGMKSFLKETFPLSQYIFELYQYGKLYFFGLILRY